MPIHRNFYKEMKTYVNSMEVLRLQVIKSASIIVGLIVLGIFEALFPLFHGQKNRLRHDAVNMSLWLMNILIVGMLYGLFILGISRFLHNNIKGLLEFIGLSQFPKFVVAFLLIDLWMYTIHFANHKFSFMWRFHRVHHSDEMVNTTTGFRFHLGEILISLMLRVLITPLLGIDLLHFLVYELVLIPVLLVQHSDIRFNMSLDEFFSVLFATPKVHHVHHSSKQKEADTNFASVLSLWDRLFGTYCSPAGVGEIRYGISGPKNKADLGLNTLLGMPFENKKAK